MKLLKTTIKHTENYSLASGYYSRVNEFSIPEEEGDNIQWYQEMEGLSWGKCKDPFAGRVRPDVPDRKITDTNHLILRDGKEYIRTYCSSPEKISWFEDQPPYYSTSGSVWIDTDKVFAEVLENEFQVLMNKLKKK